MVNNRRRALDNVKQDAPDEASSGHPAIPRQQMGGPARNVVNQNEDVQENRNEKNMA
ncbi:hypothetical protein JCGZ_19321 [Jatropha curcas]|uniref:Uncharacterized protein n=1 Tax=Jatropha curcas TaxID=180498 RepID=A0A067K0R7_JATCU|nr:hypothetical protein JCGZ_19321 [Jatropha curcas]